ncbi:MAG: SufE family protein, partial [Candidatus Melainabacteria bacterium]|nr:SufE family protein [Candidatus Melainabacteria bacterium]
MTHSSCNHKQDLIIQAFAACTSAEQRYEKIIALGRQLPSYPSECKTPDRLVKGCQSEMYLHAALVDGKVYFSAYSEALISAGLAALLLAVYNEEPPEAVLSCPPRFLDELAIHNSLSPGRSNGLASLFQKMKQEALKFL